MFRNCATLLTLMTLVGCASTGAKPEPFPRPTRGSSPHPAPPAAAPDAPLPTPTPTAESGAITSTALSLRGTPYRNGGNDPSGFDCSGFVWYVFAQHGITVPRTVGEQYGVAGPVTQAAIAPGDLVFFDTSGHGVSHVGIALGPDSFVHAPSSRGEVRIERLGGTYWGPRFVGARRVSP
jgi:cell wall-associated NlpC family hydrolase